MIHELIYYQWYYYWPWWHLTEEEAGRVGLCGDWGEDRTLATLGCDKVAMGFGLALFIF